MSAELKVDPTRAHLPETGIVARAKVHGKRQPVDIAHLDTISLMRWVGSKGPGFELRTLLMVLHHRVPGNPPLRSDEACPVHREVCPVHQYVHGAEAEELRAGVERLISTRVLGGGAEEELEIFKSDLHRLLDKVDARDSLAYREAQGDPKKRERARR